MTTIDTRGALHDGLGQYTNKNQPAAGYDLGGEDVHATILRDIATHRQITNDVTEAVTGADLNVTVDGETVFLKDTGEAFEQDSDNMVDWSDDPNRGRDFMEVRVGPHIMYVDPNVDDATGEVTYESPDGDWAFDAATSEDMTQCVGDFLRAEAADHPARRLDAFKNEGLASAYGATMDPETAALLVVRDQIDEATLPGTIEDDGTTDSPAGEWSDLSVEAQKVLRDADDTQRYWAEQYYAVRQRREEREKAERLLAQRERQVSTCESNLAYLQSTAEFPYGDPLRASAADVMKAKKGLDTARRWLTGAQEKVAALPEPLKKAYVQDVERGFEDATAALDAAKREARHGASAAEMDLGFTVDSNTLTPEDVLELRNAYAEHKRIAPEAVSRADLRSIAHDYAVDEARRRQEGLRADMLVDALTERGVPAVVATFKDDTHVPSDLDNASISGGRWSDGWHRLSDKEHTFVRFTDSYTDTARVVAGIAPDDVLRRRKNGEVVSGRTFHSDSGRLALRDGTTWDLTDATAQVAVTGMGRTPTTYLQERAATGAVDEGETAWVLDQAAGAGAVPLF